MNLCRLRRMVVWVFATASVVLAAPSERIDIAAAANMARVVEPLTAAFAQAEPDLELRTSIAATGSLVAQIRHGAPFAVLLSADPDYPAALLESGDAVPDSFTPFANGLLMLWPAPSNGLADLARTTPAPRIAIANPDTAPFGVAARAVLSEAGLWATLEPRLIVGENVAQTLHFVQSGNADHGFVAASLLNANQRRAALALPSTERALQHTAVLLRRGAASAGARRFIAWLRSPAAQAVLRDHGYAPVSENPGIDAAR